jgi:hypothetical protein
MEQPSTSFTINCEDRWQVYHRLQELDIVCQCQGFQPLKANIKTASEVIHWIEAGDSLAVNRWFSFTMHLAGI